MENCLRSLILDVILLSCIILFLSTCIFVFRIMVTREAPALAKLFSIKIDRPKNHHSSSITHIDLF